MTTDEAKFLLEDVRTRYDSAFSPADKNTIERLYEAVLGKRLRVTTCQRCYHDAVIEITLHLRKNNVMVQEKHYIMKSGFVISCPTFHNGEIYTHLNVTDEICEEYLTLYPHMAKFFDKVPDKPIFARSAEPKASGEDSLSKKERKPRKLKKKGI